MILGRFTRCASALAVAIATPVAAQTASDQGSGGADKSSASKNQFGDIVVTALRRTQSVLRTPAAITAISGDELKEKGVNTVVDLQNLVPGVNISTGQDGVNIGIRGVQTTDTSSKGEQDIAFSIDGANVGRGNARGSAFFDIDRVEVLRGPQGTLYGRNSTGGAVNIITKRPQLGEWSGYVKAEYGNYDAKRAEGAINVPLGSTLAFRLAGNVNNRDGYSKPVGYSFTNNGTTYNVPAVGSPRNDQVDATGRASLYFEPAKTFSARLTATFGNQKGHGSSTQTQDMLTSSTPLAILANPIPAFVNNYFFNVDGSIKALLGGTQLDVLASHQYFRLNQQRTDNFNALLNSGQFGTTLLNSPTNTSQVEARLSNANPGLIDYVAGANYFYESISEDGHLWRVDPSITGAITLADYQHFFEIYNQTSHKAYGFFAQGTFHANDKLGLVAGVRYSHDEVERVGHITPQPMCPGVTYPASCSMGLPNEGSEIDHKITWRFGANYQINPANLVYASVASGFKAGGFNDYDPNSTNASGTGVYAPSQLVAYELGYKGRPIEGLTLASDFFYYDFSKNQINSAVAFPASGQNTLFTITTPTEIYGLENEINYRFTKHTSLNATVSYQRSRFINFQAGGVYGDQVSWRDRDLDQTPRFVATGAFEQSFDLPREASLQFRAQSKYSSAYYLSDISNAIRYRQSPFTRTNLTLTYQAARERWNIQLFVENVENKVQRNGALAGYSGPYGGAGGQLASAATYPTPGNGTLPAQPFGYINFSTTSPRFFGVRAGAKF